MCGRYKVRTPISVIIDAFSPLIPTFEPELFPPKFNAAPGQDLPVVRLDDKGHRVLDLLTWGFMSDIAADGVPRMNAKSETIAGMPMWRDAFKERRCLVPADGFFEWIGKGTRPHLIELKDGGVFGFAGIWQEWKGKNKKGQDVTVEGFAIITTTPNELMKPIHRRMPVILKPENYLRWLGSTSLPKDLMAPYPDGELKAIEVTTHVNKTDHEDEGCIAPMVGDSAKDLPVHKQMNLFP